MSSLSGSPLHEHIETFNTRHALYTNSIVLALFIDHINCEGRNTKYVHVCPPTFMPVAMPPFSVGRRHATYIVSTHAPRMPTLTPHLPAPSPKGPHVSSHHVSNAPAAQYFTACSPPYVRPSSSIPNRTASSFVKTPPLRRRSPASTVVHATSQPPIRFPPILSMPHSPTQVRSPRHHRRLLSAVSA